MMKGKIFALKGLIVHTPQPKQFTATDGYLVCENGKVKGIYERLPEEMKSIPVADYSGRVIIPGMSDLHLHAPQYGFRGMGMILDTDASWETWFDRYAFPEESHYSNMDYAEKAYEKFTDDLLHTTTTRISAFATIHREATELLMKKLNEKGFAGYVGKVNTDRNSTEGLLETTDESLSETSRWLSETADKYKMVKPIITPRYIPSCTDRCMEGLQKLMEEYRVPAQSHLSENLEEIEWVKSLKPEIDFYGQAYDMYGMLGDQIPSIMAHCIFPTDEEFELISRRKNLWVAHCPQSNFHSCGSAAPVRKYIEAGVHVGLGTDMAGSPTLNMLRAVFDCSIASRIYWAANERNDNPHAVKTYLSLPEAFYLATKGGGSFWGKVGSFEEGYDFDAVVIDDRTLHDLNERPILMRMERIISTCDERHIKAKFIAGNQIL